MELNVHLYNSEAEAQAAAKQAALERAAADEAAKMALREKMARKAEREAFDWKWGKMNGLFPRYRKPSHAMV